MEALDGRVLDRAVHPLDLAVGSTGDRVWSAVTNLSHSASFHRAERIAPSNPGIKHLGLSHSSSCSTIPTARKRRALIKCMQLLFSWAVHFFANVAVTNAKSLRPMSQDQLSLPPGSDPWMSGHLTPSSRRTVVRSEGHYAYSVAPSPYPPMRHN